MRDRITAVLAATGVATLMAGAIVMGVAGAAQADSDNANENANGGQGQGQGNSNAGGNNGNSDDPKKVFVCKYVGTPGPDERLQTGQNPISVSVNSIKDFPGVGGSFADRQGRSLVIAFDDRDERGQQGEPEPDCPEGEDPQVCPDGTDRAGQPVGNLPCDEDGNDLVAPLAPTAGPADCESDGVLSIPTQPANVSIKSQSGDGPGPVTFVFEAADGFEFANGLSETSLVVNVPAQLTGLECDEIGGVDDEDACPNIRGLQENVPAGFSVVNGRCVKDQVKGVDKEKPADKPVIKGVEAEAPAPAAAPVPTAVDAGIGGPMAGSTTTTLLGQGLVGGGLMLLLLAGWMRKGQLPRGAHQV